MVSRELVGGKNKIINIACEKVEKSFLRYNIHQLRQITRTYLHDCTWNFEKHNEFKELFYLFYYGMLK